MTDKADEKKQADKETEQAKTPDGMRRVRLVRSIVLSGEHADEGSVHDVSLPLAHRLIGEGSAVHHLEKGEKPEAGPTSVNRMMQPGNADPVSRMVRPAPPKFKGGAKGRGDE